MLLLNTKCVKQGAGDCETEESRKMTRVKDSAERVVGEISQIAGHVQSAFSDTNYHCQSDFYAQ